MNANHVSIDIEEATTSFINGQIETRHNGESPEVRQEERMPNFFATMPTSNPKSMSVEDHTIIRDVVREEPSHFVMEGAEGMSYQPNDLKGSFMQINRQAESPAQQNSFAQNALMMDGDYQENANNNNNRDRAFSINDDVNVMPG